MKINVNIDNIVDDIIEKRKGVYREEYGNVTLEFIYEIDEACNLSISGYLCATWDEDNNQIDVDSDFDEGEIQHLIYTQILF